MQEKDMFNHNSKTQRKHASNKQVLHELKFIKVQTQKKQKKTVILF